MRGVTLAFFPYLQKNNSNWRTCLHIRNVSDWASNLVGIHYYQLESPFGEWYEEASIAPNGMLALCQNQNANLPNGQLSGWVESRNGQPFVAAVNQDQLVTRWEMSYNGVAQPSRTALAPLVMKNNNLGGSVYRSGLMIQNTSDSDATVRVTYYWGDGPLLPYSPSQVVRPKRSWGVDLNNDANLPEGFIGSAVITSDKPIAVVANGRCINCAADTTYTYTAVNR